MFVYQSRFLRRGEVWFDNDPGEGRVDWILYRNRSRPVPGAKWRYFYNRLIDLSKSGDDLLAEMSPKTLAKIRSAEAQDRNRCERCDPSDGRILLEIEQAWNSSVESKRRWGPLNRQWLGAMIGAQAFELFIARDLPGNPLVYAGVFRDRTRVQQLMSVSPPRTSLSPEGRAKTNRASCYLLWSIMQHLKQEGVHWFDFGGWYPGTEDIQLLGANAYKKGFGGQVIREFECEQIVSLKGWIILTAARILARLRQFRADNSIEWEANADATPA